MPEYKYDFECIKREVTVPMVLEHEGIVFKTEGDHVRAACPFQNGHGASAFIAWANGWKCHSCSRKGNVIDLVCDLKGFDRKEGAVEAAKLIYAWFALADSRPAPPPDAAAPPAAPLDEEPSPNPPLKFALKGVTPDHPYLASRGFLRGHAEYLGAGFFPGKGSMQGRFVFAIHNRAGELVSYAGRLIDDAALTDETPRWLLGKGFKKTLELYNLHRVLRGECASVVVVESFWGVFACVRAGILNVVALMGRELSERQAELLSQFSNITLLMDGDEPGRAASAQIGAKLLSLPNRSSVKVVFLPDGEQPDTIPPEELPGLLF